MDKTDVIYLVKQVNQVNEFGDSIPVETQRKVWVNVSSVTMAEKYQALQNGLDPEITFVFRNGMDYEGETKLFYKGNPYRVIRVADYSSDKLRIICTRYGLTEVSDQN